MHISRSTPIALALALVVGGCSTPIEPDRALTAPSGAVPSELADVGMPADPSGRALYPLDLGNRWRFARRFSTQFFPHGRSPNPAVIVESEVERVLTCIEDPYTIEASTEVISTDQGPVTTSTWARYRQDADGLFQSRLPLDQPPACGGATLAGVSRSSLLARIMAARLGGAPDASLESELSRIQRCLDLAHGVVSSTGEGDEIARARDNEATVLAYPLHPLRFWTVVTIPTVFAWSEAVEMVELPAGRFVAQRVRVHVPGLMGSDDYMRMWVSRSGFLKLEARLLLPVILNGQVGNLLIRESEILQELELSSTPPQ